MAGQYWNYQINPVSGCTKISEACQNCYAAITHNLHHANGKGKGFFNKPFNEITLRPEQLKKFDKLKGGEVVFIGNMCDLFHDAVPDDYIKEVFESIELINTWFNAESQAKTGNKAPTFLILTKRAKRMNEFIKTNYPDFAFRKKFPNVWVGVTAENQIRADERIPYLLDAPVAHRWVSIEPMLGPISLQRIFEIQHPYDDVGGEIEWIYGLDTIICGGESGYKARETKQEWIEDLYQQCYVAHKKFYLKQLGDSFKGLWIGVDTDAREQPWLNTQIARLSY
jgi:protein gp37